MSQTEIRPVLDWFEQNLFD